MTRFISSSWFRLMSVMPVLTAASEQVASKDVDPQFNVVFNCRPDNDLYRVMSADGAKYPRYDTADQAVRQAPEGAGVLVLADDYPRKPTPVDSSLFETAAAKKLRLYVEYPAMLPGMTIGQPKTHRDGPYGSNLDREVITSDAFAPALEKTRIVLIHDCTFLPVEARDPHIVVARVSGYDTAIFGLPKDNVWPILFEHPRGDVLVATTKLSHFVTGRYAPTEAWGPIWQMILGWTQPGRTVPRLKWTPTVRPSYARDEKLPEDAELQALRRGVAWYGKTKLFVDPSGSKGFHEGYNSKEVFQDGSQAISPQIRGDCHGEVAMSLAFGARIFGDPSYRKTSENLLDLIYVHSIAGKGARLDPKSPTFGLIGGDLVDDSGVYYGDDFARRQLGTMATAALFNEQRWDERALMDMLGHFRTTGPWGFRVARLEEPEIQAAGWQRFWLSSDGCWGGQRYLPHYQAYMWAVYFWLYDRTKFEPLLTRTKTGIRLMMEAYPDHWGSEANRYETERCRMLLPLAWLIRVDDRPEHRQWLRQITDFVLSIQDASGAIPQTVVHETTTNEQYGTGECALVQRNGDPCTDLLYATNFAFVGLHEAAAVTGDRQVARAADRLTDFLVRIQARSETHPELDGAWYRGFDFRKWDYWGSDGDIGWGVWCIETGWTQGWITAALALRHMKTTLWDLTAGSKIARHMEKYRPMMLPDDVLKEDRSQNVSHKTVGKPVKLANPYFRGYSGGGDTALTDGVLALAVLSDPHWQGFEGVDLDATIDLRDVVPFNSVSSAYLQHVKNGIFLPTQVEYAISDNGQDFRTIAVVTHDVPLKTEGPLIRRFDANVPNIKAHYLRVRAPNIARIPDWHHAKGSKAWLFVDEITVN